MYAFVHMCNIFIFIIPFLLQVPRVYELVYSLVVVTFNNIISWWLYSIWQGPKSLGRCNSTTLKKFHSNY